MPQPYVTVWDGKFLQFRERSQAITDALAGLVQIFTGPTGYQPGFFMADPHNFPLPATPSPTLTSIAPSSGEINSGTKALTLTGTNFTDADVVKANGVVIPHSYVNPTTITATLPASASAGTVPILVEDPYGRQSVARNFTWNALPTLASVAPNTGEATTAIPLLTLTGTGFTNQSVANIGGVDQATTFVSATSLTVANYTPAAAGNVPVLVKTPGKSNTGTQNITVSAAP